jgi:hypothetical protein
MQTGGGPPVGRIFTEIRGRSADHRAVTVSLRDANGPHLLLALSPSCPYCRVNFHNWRLLESMIPAERIIWLDVVGDVPSQYIYSEGISKASTIISIDQDTATKDDIAATPTTIVLNAGGEVIWSWAGVLSKVQMNQVQSVLASDHVQHGP